MRVWLRILAFALVAFAIWGISIPSFFSIDWKWDERLAAAEQKLGPGVETEIRFYTLDEAAKAAAELGELEKATVYANELLELAPEFLDNWNYGNAIHDGHMVLGRVALVQGDLDSARAELRAAGASPGSPQLNSFGPNMALAKDLLEAGEKQVVLDYFELVGTFWSLGATDLEQWSARVRSGRSPDFGAHLGY